MILEVQKINDQYVIMNLPKTAETHFFLQIEKKDILKNKPLKNTKPVKDKAFEQLKAMAEKYPENQFLQNDVKFYIPYKNTMGKTDDDYLYDALKEKYGL